MLIDIKLIGRLAEINTGDSSIALAQGATVDDALSELGLTYEQIGPLSLNDSIVAKGEWGGTTLFEGDRITIMPPIKGG